LWAILLLQLVRSLEVPLLEEVRSSKLRCDHGPHDRIAPSIAVLVRPSHPKAQPVLSRGRVRGGCFEGWEAALEQRALKATLNVLQTDALPFLAPLLLARSRLLKTNPYVLKGWSTLLPTHARDHLAYKA